MRKHFANSRAIVKPTKPSGIWHQALKRARKPDKAGMLHPRVGRRNLLLWSQPRSLIKGNHRTTGRGIQQPLDKRDFNFSRCRVCRKHTCHRTCGKALGLIGVSAFHLGGNVLAVGGSQYARYAPVRIAGFSKVQGPANAIDTHRGSPGTSDDGTK